jgi:methionine synthase II (cobalamin-independent)
MSVAKEAYATIRNTLELDDIILRELKDIISNIESGKSFNILSKLVNIVIPMVQINEKIYVHYKKPVYNPVTHLIEY